MKLPTLGRWVAAVVPLLAGCLHHATAPLNPGQSADELRTRSLADPALRRFMEAGLGRSFVTWPPEAWDFETLTLVAFRLHPDLAVARAEWGVTRAGITTAGARPNPVLTATPGYSANSPAGVSPWFPTVTLDVPLETAGKRGYRLACAEHKSAAARARVTGAAWRVRGEVRASLLEALAIDRRLAALESQAAAQAEVVGLYEQRVAGGIAATADATPARIARLKTMAEIETARTGRSEARARLATALGLPIDAVRNLKLEGALSPPSGTSPAIPVPAARDWALTNRADVLASLEEYAAAEATLRLELAKQYPDVHLAPGYQYDQGEHKWSLGLSVELPVLHRNQGPIGEALARRNEAAARFRAVQAGVLAEIERAAEAGAAANRQVAGAVALRDAARRQLDSAEAARRAGGVDRLDVALARVEAAAAELPRLEAEDRVAAAAARLEEALQIRFDGLRLAEADEAERKYTSP